MFDNGASVYTQSTFISAKTTEFKVKCLRRVTISHAMYSAVSP